ncbi:MAG: SurA N-terminal domain-containing protein [Bacteroidaceae bacterium]|nr:SurA N-terminal domain-containing protein [Bacteroidaceae bacterium]
MAVLETIRVKFGIVISVLIAVALLSFIIDPSTLQSVSNSMSSKYDVGEIDGKSISYADFQAEVEKFTTLSEMNGNPVQGEEALAMVRQQAWKQFIDNYLFIPSAKAAGFNVGEEEMFQLMSGEMMSNVLMQVFQGNLNKDLLVQLEAEVAADETGRMQMFWDNLLDAVNKDQFYTKYQSLFAMSSFTNDLMLADQVKGNNNTFDVEFVMLPYGFAKDSTIVVSDKEIKAYYDTHKDMYKQNASRDIEYVVFEIVPSADDIAAANNAVANSYEAFAQTENMKSFLLSYSDRQYDNHWYKAGELNSVSKNINDYVFGKDATVSEIFENGTTFQAVRVMESAMVPDSVYVKYVASNVEDVDAALAEATAEWIPQIPGFEALMTADKNAQMTINGMVFQVLDKTAPVAKKRVAILEKTAQPSDATRSSFYAKANTLATKSAGKYEKFQTAVQEEGLYAHPFNKMPEGANRLGSVEHTKEVTRWAFDAKVGEVSNIISIDNKYYVIAALKGVHKEGYTPVAEVATRIESVLYQEKLAEKKAAEVAEKIQGMTELEAVAEALGTTVSSKEDVTFASFTSSGLDNKFIGAASVAEEGVLNGPVKGNTGVYVYKVTGRSEGAFFTEDDAKNRDMQMNYSALRMLLPVMMDAADVKDNTARFY